MKFVDQLTSTAILMAAGLGPCEKSSAVISQGIEPAEVQFKEREERESLIKI